MWTSVSLSKRSIAGVICGAEDVTDNDEKSFDNSIANCAGFGSDVQARADIR